MANIDSLKQALAFSPDNVPLILLLAQAHLDAFGLDEAGEQFQRALSLDPGNVTARVGLAQILDLNGKTSEAILRIEQVCAEFPNYAPAWKLRSKMALNESDARTARACYDKAISLDPECADE
ncbi:MAG: tetratricopeptide repeat protein, partial [Verrucomicrobiae bacterium]|nr:tetratricopeptide repeat protein [Verrucomicrobiae bacterium]